MIQQLFPPDVITAVATPEMWDGRLLPEEEICVQRAVTKRRREFTAGRVCARQALAALGIADVPLGMGSDRLPVWPEGIIGSISHCDGYCGVAIARASRVVSLGLDVEGADPLESGTTRIVCAEAELSQADLFPDLAIGGVAKLIFSAKEAAFKCWYPLGRKILEFSDVRIAFDRDRSAFSALFLKEGASLQSGISLEGRFALDASRVYAGVTLHAS